MYETDEQAVTGRHTESYNDAFAYILSVGYTDDEARDLLAQAEASGATFKDAHEFATEAMANGFAPGAGSPAPQTNGEPAEPTPAVDQARALEILRIIFESNRHVGVLAAAAEDAKKRAKIAKDDWESAADAHSRMERRMEAELYPDRQPFPLLDSKPAEANGTPAPAAAANLNDDWRRVSVHELTEYGNVTTGVTQTLCDAGIETLGDLADYTAGDKPLTDVKGIGDAKAEAICEALDGFWAARKVEQGKPVGEPCDA
jgi:hypothetical protein